MRKHAKFVQLVAVQGTLHALDARGGVWVLMEGDPPTRWGEVSSEREYLSDADADQGC